MNAIKAPLLLKVVEEVVQEFLEQTDPHCERWLDWESTATIRKKLAEAIEGAIADWEKETAEPV